MDNSKIFLVLNRKIVVFFIILQIKMKNKNFGTLIRSMLRCSHPERSYLHKLFLAFLAANTKTFTICMVI